MKIKLENSITIDNQIDIITEEYESEWVIKGDTHYFSYINNEKEKVVIKYRENELVMSRFSSPTSVMRFRLKKFDNAKILTPLGLQNLVTKTHCLEMSAHEKRIFLHYDLLIEPETDNILASYQLTLNWFD
ncbi:DUF1934 domain-containing protein [Streptococcus marimammalium]|uniref:DUF1934 domain-containing protein n=1 Tax=Streptococcus marimammalium TaxID=269666 RepID=UPI000381D09D|nr:DUF1934 domain-containing protein [Streptococcus marimammalium]